MPSITITSAPALAASLTSSRVRGRADLDVDRHLPVGRLADLLDLQAQVGRTDEVGVAHRRALVDAERQVAHARDLVRDLRAQQHAAGAGLGALADDDLDRVRLRHVVRVVPVVRGADLVDEVRRVAPAPCGCMPPSPVVVDVPARVAPRPTPAFALRDSAPKLMPQTVIGMSRSSGLLGEARAEHRRASRSARGSPRAARARACREEREVVEVRHGPRRGHAAVAVAAELGLELDVLDDRRGSPDRVVVRARSAAARRGHRRSCSSHRLPPDRELALVEVVQRPPEPNLRQPAAARGRAARRARERAPRRAGRAPARRSRRPAPRASPPRKMSPAYIESPRPSSASPQTTSMPSLHHEAVM